jgi:hypothetical protein
MHFGPKVPGPKEVNDGNEDGVLYVEPIPKIITIRVPTGFIQI